MMLIAQKKQKVRRLIKEETDKLFEKCDFMILPTTAPSVGEHQGSLSMNLTDLFTVQTSLCGIPEISIPNCEDNSKMPISQQEMVNSSNEGQLLAFSKYILENNC